MKTVAFHNLGCKVNAYEMDAMLQALTNRGYQVVPFDKKADIYIVNTCTVTNIADRKSRQMLHKAKKINPQAVVVAVGCYVQSDPQAAEADNAVDLMIGNNKKKDLVDILEHYLEGKDVREESVIDLNHTKEYEEMRLTSTQEHTRAYIKIQDGCNQFCTYCIIPYARGRVRSRQKSDILSEIQGLAAAGYKEFVLTGIHISSYGIDFAEDKDGANQCGGNLIALLQAIDKMDGVERIRLGSLEPRIITEDFVRNLAEIKYICPHFHLSLQSGCAATLKRMNRHYTPKQYMERVTLLRSAFEHPAITTDIITGFPGETEEEFLQTKQFVEAADFFETHIFKYSKRKGTKAAEMEQQVPEQTKARRSQELQKIGQEASKRFCSYYLGKEVDVLIEEEKEISGGRYWIGHTKEYVKAAVKAEVITKVMAEPGQMLSNQMIHGRITDVIQEDIMLLSMGIEP